MLSVTATTRAASRCSYHGRNSLIRSFMSTQALASPEEESQMVLILGKPGGGKGTISGKILQVGPCIFPLGYGSLVNRYGRTTLMCPLTL